MKQCKICSRTGQFVGFETCFLSFFFQFSKQNAEIIDNNEYNDVKLYKNFFSKARF